MDKNTIKCISIAEKPGTFGVEFHNRGYELLGLNYNYLPLRVNSSQLESVIKLVRDNFHGCSVSMPHKIKVMKYLNDLDKSAKRIGAVNTILNENEKLIGYNTDYYGAKRAIESQLEIKGKEVFMFGAGGVAKAIAYAVNDLGGKLTITNRTEAKALNLAANFDSLTLPYAKSNKISGHLLINATNMGADNQEDMLTTSDTISKFDAVMDAVISKEKETKLIREAKLQNKKYITGRTMTVYQAAEQFKIYTGRELPESFILGMLSS